MLIATHARRHDPAKQSAGMTRGVRGKEPGSTDSVGGDRHPQGRFVGQRLRRRSQLSGREQVPAPPSQVAVVGGHLEISIGEPLIRRHKIKHDRTREHARSTTPAADTPDQRRLNPTRPVNQLPKSPRQAGTEA